MVFLRRRGISKSAGCPDKSMKLLNAETGLCSNRSLESSEWCPQFLLLHHHYHHRPSPSGLDLLAEVRVCNLARKKTQHHSTGRRDLRRLRSRFTELGSGRNWARDGPGTRAVQGSGLRWTRLSRFAALAATRLAAKFQLLVRCEGLTQG